MNIQSWKTRSLLLFLFCYFGQTCLAQTVKHGDHEGHEHPKIALVLSGGGAKGIAHIGVIKVLEEAGIRPDIITGTSIGSIMGGLYAIGYTVEDMEKMAKGLDWNYYFNDELKRTDLPIEERHHADRYQVKFGIENNKIQFPKGFIQGQKIGLLLSYLTFPAHGVNDFNKFPIPFQCIATDAETGEKVILKSGSLAKAMRASMSLPSIFEPMELDGKVLIDGGVIQNLPVQEAIDMGADIIIAVDISSPLYKREELKSLVQVLAQTSSYKLAENVLTQRDLADIVISPEVQKFGTLDFSEVDTLIMLGEKATREQLSEIIAIVKPHVHKNDHKTAKAIAIPKSCKVCNVKVLGIRKGRRQNTIANVMQMRTTKEYSVEVIEKRIKQLFGGQFFRDAYYELTQSEEGYELSIDAEQKSGEYLQLSMNYDSDMKAALLLNATFRNRGLSGSKFTTDLKLSENPMLKVGYQVYTTSQPNFGIQINGLLNHYPMDLYNDTGELDDISSLYNYNLRLNLFSSFNNSSLVSGGIGLNRLSKRNDFFDRKTEDLALNQSLLYFNFIHDTYDRQSYPKEGFYVNVEGQFAIDNTLRFPDDIETRALNNMAQSARVQFSKIFKVTEKFSIKSFNDIGIVGFQDGTSPNNYLNLFYLGRSIPEISSHVEFIGLDYMELPVSGYWMTGVKFRLEVFDNIFGSILFNYGQYRAKTYERIFKDAVQVVPTQDGNIYGLGGEVGFVTPIGPGRMSVEYNLKESNLNYALHLGYLF